MNDKNDTEKLAQALRELAARWISPGYRGMSNEDEFAVCEACSNDLLKALAAHESRAQPAITVTDEMVQRFLGWRLPDTFAPDCYVSFDREGIKKMGNGSHWPSGTNLLNDPEARAMFEHVLAVAPPPAQPESVAVGYITPDGKFFGYALDEESDTPFFPKERIDVCIASQPPSVAEDYREIARLIGCIFFYGDFKAETPNERDLEVLLRRTGNFYETEDQLIAASPHRAAPQPPAKDADSLNEPLNNPQQLERT